jgi:hypothetical protein
MAQGRIGLGKLQFGIESTPGTSVAATTVWRGPASFIEDQRLVKLVEEAVGILGGTNRSYIPELLAGLSLAETEFTFEQFPYLLASGWGGPVTGTEDGMDTDVYIYSTNVPTTSTASMTGKTITARGGDDHEVEIMEYGFCSEFSLKGAIREAIKMSGMLIGRQAAVSSFTGAIALPAVEEGLVQASKLYLDAIDGTVGTTQVASTIVGFEIGVKTGLMPQFTMDGTLYFTKILAADPEITGKITFLHDTGAGGASGEKAKWRAQTPRLLQLKCEGSTFADPGTTYSKKTLLVNLPIKWTKFSALENKDGATICTGEFVAKYDETAATAGSFVVVNSLTALT